MPIIIAAVIVLALLMAYLAAYRLAKKHETGVAEEFAGICAAALDQTIRKNENKRKIVALLREWGEMNNAAIRAELGISRNSVVRYLDELEREGVAEQVGTTGRFATYRLR